jgi:hypothetical protein
MPRFGNVERIESENGHNPEYFFMRWGHQVKTFKPEYEKLKWLALRNISVLSCIRHPLKVFGTILRESIEKGMRGNRRNIGWGSTDKDEIKDYSRKYCMSNFNRFYDFLNNTYELKEEPNLFLIYIDKIGQMKPSERLEYVKDTLSDLKLEFNQKTESLISNWTPINSNKKRSEELYTGSDLELFQEVYHELSCELFDEGGKWSWANAFSRMCTSDLVNIKHGYGDSQPYTIEAMNGSI